MKASVVLPVFNKAPFLIECLESILVQGLNDFELIAVDDKSTDDSLAILEGIDDRRLRILRSERNMGPAGAMQLGVDAAGGEYVIRVDADDVCLPGRFEKQVAFMERNPSIGFSGGALSLLHRPETLRSKPLGHEACRVELLFGVAVHQPTAIFRSAVLRGAGRPFAADLPRWGEDWLVQLDLSEVTRIGNLPEPLTRYRIGPHNSGKGRDRSADLTQLTRRAFAHFGLSIRDADLAYAFLAQKHFEEELVPDAVRGFKHWLMRTREEVIATKRLSTVDVNRRFDQAWDDLCYFTPSHGHKAVMAYLFADKRPSWMKARYLLSSVIRGNYYVNDDPE